MKFLIFHFLSKPLDGDTSLYVMATKEQIRIIKGNLDNEFRTYE